MKKQRENKKIKKPLTTNGLFQLGIIPATILKTKLTDVLFHRNRSEFYPKTILLSFNFNVYFIHHIDYGRFTNPLYANIIHWIYDMELIYTYKKL